MGVPAEHAEAMLAQERESEAFEIHPDNVEAVALFLQLKTQWRIVAGATRAVHLGIVYASIPVVMDLLGVPLERRPALFGELRVMEYAALGVLNKSHEDD